MEVAAPMIFSGLMFVGTCWSHKPDLAGFNSQTRYQFGPLEGIVAEGPYWARVHQFTER